MVQQQDSQNQIPTYANAVQTQNVSPTQVYSTQPNQAYPTQPIYVVQQNPNSMQSKGCNYCQKFGHFEKNCHTKANDQQNKITTTQTNLQSSQIPPSQPTTNHNSNNGNGKKTNPYLNTQCQLCWSYGLLLELWCVVG